MDKLFITGGTPLHGEISIAGAKNSALPIMAATLLTDETITLCNVPCLRDIQSMTNLLADLGVNIICKNNNTNIDITQIVNNCDYQTQWQFCAKNIKSTQASYDLVKKMRASIAVMGPLLARFGKAKISMPGGCAIGARPVDLHIMAIEALGATVSLTDGYIVAKAPKQGLKGNTIVMPKVSVMATENAMMAATLALGQTIIKNAAEEPEVVDLGNMLINMGAKISGLGTDEIKIEGVKKLHGTSHKIIPDRLEAMTYAICAIATGGAVTLKNINLTHCATPLQILKNIGCKFEETDNTLKVLPCNPKNLKGMDLVTAPFPNFPTDLQAQFMALSCLVGEKSSIKEMVFENRFMHVAELNRMNANIATRGDMAVISPINEFLSAQVMATDLRASVAMVIAALNAKGTTIIDRIYHMDRGYEKLEQKLSACGANISRKH